MSTGPPRILIYTQDSFGLGHLRRATTLANALVHQISDLSVLLVVDSPVAPFFQLADGVDFVKLPTVVKIGAGVFRAGRLQTGYEMVRALRERLLGDIVLRFQPHLVLVDHMPGGANRELVPALKLIRQRGLPTTTVLGLRDIIDNPDVTCAMWKREGVYETMGRYYDRVLIYGSPEVFPTAEKYCIPEAVQQRLHYCGYICNMAHVKAPAQVRAKLGAGGDPLVVVMAGGGADAYQLMQTYMEAVRHFPRTLSCASVIVTGPFMPQENRKALREQARGLPVRIHSTVGDTLSQINAADLVVSMAGYNTLSEILRFKKRAIIVPRPGPSAEQSMRANLFAQRGLVQVLDQDRLSAQSLAGAVQESLATPAPPASRPWPRLNGIATVTAALIAAIPSRPPPEDQAGPAAPVVAVERPQAETLPVAE